MRIVISLDSMIENLDTMIESFVAQKKNEHSDAAELSNEDILELCNSEWLDYKSLIPPDTIAEEKINAWYDLGHKICILLPSNEEKNYDKKWLKDHYIPYDELLDHDSDFSTDADFIITDSKIWQQRGRALCTLALKAPWIVVDKNWKSENDTIDNWIKWTQE